MSIEIKEIRISLVWKKAFKKDSYLPFLADRDRYIQEFNDAKNGIGNWLIPWLEGERQRFWQYYLCTNEIGELQNVDAARAWNYQVPLRQPHSVVIKTEKGTRISLEGFCFSHSVGVIATIFLNWENPVSIQNAVDQVILARHAQYSAQWHNLPQTHGSLQNLATEMVGKIHQKVIGKPYIGDPLNEPISIVTVIDAQGLSEKAGQEPLSPEQMMFGLCKMEAGWQTASIIGLSGIDGNDDKTIKPIEAVKGPVEIDKFKTPRRYAAGMGRAVWDPNKFSGVLETSATPGTHPRQRKLGCYHRNLTLATLQAGGIIALVNRIYDFIIEGSIPSSLGKPGKQAIRLLNSLYRKNDKTYNTWTVQYQIDCNESAFKRYKSVAKAVGEFWE